LSLALAEGQAAIAGGVKTAALYDDLATLLQKQKKLDEAIGKYNDGLECPATDSVRANLHLKRGLALVDKQEYGRAKEDYDLAARLEGDDPTAQAIRAEAHAMLGFIAAHQGAPAEAQREAALAMAQIRGSQHFTLWINLGCVYNALADAD